MRERAPGGQHVVVHRLDPGDELVEVPRRARLGHAVHAHAGAHLLGRVAVAPAGEHVDGDVLAPEFLGELADVAGQPALDDRGVLPGEDEDLHRPLTLPARGGSGAGRRLVGQHLALDATVLYRRKIVSRRPNARGELFAEQIALGGAAFKADAAMAPNAAAPPLRTTSRRSRDKGSFLFDMDASLAPTRY